MCGAMTWVLAWPVPIGLRLSGHHTEPILQSAQGSHGEQDCAVSLSTFRGEMAWLWAFNFHGCLCPSHTPTLPTLLQMSNKIIHVAFSFLSNTCVGVFLPQCFCIPGERLAKPQITEW